VEAFLTETSLDRIREQNSARFYPETPSLESIPLQVVRIDKDATRSLQNGLLAMGRGGSIAVRVAPTGELVPEQAVYRVILSPVGDYLPENPKIQRGKVVIAGERRSYLQHYWRNALAVIVRESGF